MNIQAGHCGKCGAPYYLESPWHGIYPPAPMPSCACWNRIQSNATNDIRLIMPKQKKYRNRVRRFMTTQEAQKILDILKDKESSPEYDDVLQWLEDACKTIVGNDIVENDE
jgi:hypothetical protein